MNDTDFWLHATTVQVADLLTKAIQQRDRDQLVFIRAIIQTRFKERKRKAIDRLVMEFLRHDKVSEVRFRRYE